MFKPVPMQCVTVQALKEDAPLAAMVLAERGVFNPEARSADAEFIKGHLPETPGEHYRELWQSARSRLDKVLAHCGDPGEPSAVPVLRRVEEDELARINDWLGEIWSHSSREQESLRRIVEERERVEQLFETLEDFASLDMDLSLLQSGRRFLDVHVGSLPSVNVARLREAVGLAGYVVSTFTGRDGSTHAVVAGPAGREQEIRSVLQAAGWHVLQIPGEFRDRPARVRERLTEQLADITLQYESQRKMIGHACDGLKERLREARLALALAEPFVNLVGEALRGRGGLVALQGWVPKSDVASLKDALTAKLESRFVLHADNPRPEERHLVPSVLKHHRWLAPFTALVRSYGVPRYGEIDPTLWFASTYVAMFGMMFGDLGQGAVIALAGLAFRKQLGKAVPFVVAAGASSAAFGWMYGSVFGFEHLIHPVWMSPISNPTLMLMVALYWGVAFILIATLMTIYNRLASGHVMEALLDSKGVAGVLLYLAILYSGARAMGGDAFGWLEAAMIAVPLLVILAYKWHEDESPVGERVLVVAIEGFETALNYFTNTLSFLRVAAFSLNHVALALAVFALANMMGTAGNWITVFLGNVFILVLEGGIVAIQALRLEYYEGFSRFFSGDGREFRPLRFSSHGLKGL